METEQQKYRFREGFRARSVTAHVAMTELERIKAEQGKLTSEGVFLAAKPDGAALHGEFIWDGDEAIRELGLNRARVLIRSIVIVPVKDDPSPVQRVFVHVADEDSDTGKGEYEKITAVVRHVDQYEIALTNLQRRFDSASEALEELRRAAEGTANADRLASIGLAVQAFGALREALAILH